MKVLDRIKLYFPYLIFILLFLLFFTSMILQFLSKENYLREDVGFFYLLTRSIVVDHKISLVGQAVMDVGTVNGFMHGVGWYYVLAIPFIIFNGHPIGAKILMFAVGVCILMFSGFFLWRYFGKKEGIFAILFFGISPYLAKYASFIESPYIVPLITIVYLYVLFLFVKSRNKKYYFITAAAIGFIVHFEIANFGFLYPSFLIFSVYLIYKRRLKIKNFLISLIIVLIFFLPHLFYDINHNFINLKGLSSSFLSDNTTTQTNFKSNIGTRYELFKANQYEIFPATTRREMIPFLTFLLIGSIIYLNDKKIKSDQKLFVKYLFGTICLTWIGLMLFPNKDVSFWWISFLTVFNIFLAAIISGYVFRSRNIFPKIVLVILIIIQLNAALKIFEHQRKRETTFLDKKYAIDVQEPIENIYAESNNKPFNILYLTSRAFEYQYFFWYLGKTKYPNTPGYKNLDLRFINEKREYVNLMNEKQYPKFTKGIYYVIINEKLANEKLTYYDLRFVNSLGKLISIQKVFNGDIIQKRIIE